MMAVNCWMGGCPLVFGLGDVFLTGYQPKNLGPENSVVRLGYLSKSEYKNIKIMINEEIEKNKDNISLVLKKYGLEFLKSLNDESKPEGNEEESREVLLALDYLIDFMACLRRFGKRMNDIDYDSVHKEKSEVSDVKMYWERIMQKRSILFKRDGL